MDAALLFAEDDLRDTGTRDIERAGRGEGPAKAMRIAALRALARAVQAQVDALATEEGGVR
jgi:hypothetical protein